MVNDLDFRSPGKVRRQKHNPVKFSTPAWDTSAHDVYLSLTAYPSTTAAIPRHATNKMAQRKLGRRVEQKALNTCPRTGITG